MVGILAWAELGPRDLIPAPASQVAPTPSGLDPTQSPQSAGTFQPTATPDLNGKGVWKRFTPPDGSFVCRLPGNPQSTSARPGHFQVRTQISADQYYMVVYTKTDDPEVRAGAVFDEYIEGLEKKGARRKDIAQDGCRGAELSWDLEKIHAMKMRCFLAPERVYEVVACGPKDSRSFQHDATMLFSSFKMTPAVSPGN